VFSRHELSKQYIRQMTLCIQSQTNALPNDVSPEYPSYACLLGNILEAASVALSQAAGCFEMVRINHKFLSVSFLFCTLQTHPMLRLFILDESMLKLLVSVRIGD